MEINDWYWVQMQGFKLQLVTKKIIDVVTHSFHSNNKP